MRTFPSNIFQKCFSSLNVVTVVTIRFSLLMAYMSGNSAKQLEIDNNLA